MTESHGVGVNWTVKAMGESYGDWQDAKLAAVVQPGQFALDEDAEDL
jgi:hypothetical protein